MAKIVLRPSLLTIRRKGIKWIIIHHTAEMYESPESRIDNSKYQMPGIFKGVMELKQGDVNYHYVIDKVNDDYIAIATRPISYLCDWPDIPDNINSRALHIALMGNYDLKIPPRRLYDILAYRLLTPMINLFKLTPSRVKLHKEVSTNKSVYCPGEFVDPGRILTAIKRFVVK